jgi:hypothetical protein
MLKIIKHDTIDNKYSLFLDDDDVSDITEIFLKSIHESCLLSGSSINSKGNSISFYAASIQSLDLDQDQGQNKKRPLSYNTVIHLVCSLSKQQQYLENYGFGFYGICLSDILVIDGCRFVNINFEMCKEIGASSSSITLTGPFHSCSGCGSGGGLSFFSPELLVIDHLPASLHYKTFYYSLGLLAIYCLFGTSSSPSIMKPIAYTKLYFFILRLLRSNPEDRHMIFV